MAALLQDPEVSQYTARIPHPYSEAMAQDFIASLAESAERVFAIRLKADDRYIGSIGIEALDRPGEAEIGFWLGKPYWRQGYGREALIALLDWGFGDLNNHTIWTGAFLANRASIALQESVGFRYRRNDVMETPARGHNHEVEMRALARDEWLARRS